MASVIAVNNETESIMNRVTKDGRKLTYEMKVLQQPQRARACGSGAKSSADRRPVDPPPVVELRVLEGDSRNDITFSHNANFFLYTTLESARPIAQGRANALPAPFPVLTGMPVAGMAYLDRPSPAGYFIFPDLSVRHEGKYRLSFNLFEELKEAKDADAEPALNNPEHPNNKLLRSSPMAPQSHVHFRLEVKSEPFVVYSAKKFPGLAESTQLSRVVAEQGCRVRIRRDVRMRRRDTKPNKDFDDYDDDGSYSRATPDVYAQQPGADRARSISNASVDNQSVYNPMEQRRPSSHDMAYYAQNGYQHTPASLPQPMSNNYGTSHLSFGGSSAPQYQTPAMPASVPQPPQAYPPNASTYQYSQGPHIRQTPTSQNYAYPVNPAPQQSQYHINQGYEDNSEYKTYRQPPIVSNTSMYHSQPTNPQPPVDTRPLYGAHNYYPQSIQPSVQSSISSATNNQLLPPFKTLQPQDDRPLSEVKIVPASISAGPTTPAYDASSNGYGQYPTTNQTPIAASGRKRSYAKVFDTTHINQSIHSGMRPDTSAHGQDVSQIVSDDGEAVDEDDTSSLRMMLSYRRADGRTQHKKCPSPITG